MLILIRGLPGSGKSTLARKYDNFYHFEADDYFIDPDGEYAFDASKLGEAHRQCQTNVRDRVICDCNVVVANTFTTMKELQPYLDIAKEFDCAVHIIQCSQDYGSIHNVPEATINKMKDRWEYISFIPSKGWVVT